jgi:primase-polymerase (primpol)-like protein
MFTGIIRNKSGYNGGMDKRKCGWCGTGIGHARADARYCSARCRVYANRAAPRIPLELTSRARWIRHSATKVPLSVSGTWASSTQPWTWSNYAAATASTAGVGLGFVLNGDGIGCYDLDHCITDGKLSGAAREFIDGTPHFYAERSPSGDGLHLWVLAPAQPGWRRTIDGLSVEFYTRDRYMTVTGRKL